MSVVDCAVLFRSENPHLMKSAALVKRSARSRTIQALEEKLKLLEMEEQVTALNTVPQLLVCACGAHAAVRPKKRSWR